MFCYRSESLTRPHSQNKLILYWLFYNLFFYLYWGVVYLLNYASKIVATRANWWIIMLSREWLLFVLRDFL